MGTVASCVCQTGGNQSCGHQAGAEKRVQSDLDAEHAVQVSDGQIAQQATILPVSESPSKDEPEPEPQARNETDCRADTSTTPRAMSAQMATATDENEGTAIDHQENQNQSSEGIGNTFQISSNETSAAITSTSVMGSTSTKYKNVILGGGVSAGYACKRLVELGIGEGDVCLISNEPVLPYERPALTKAYMHPPGAKVRARLPGFHTCVGSGGERQGEEWYEQNKVKVIQGTASAIDRTSRTLQLGSGSIQYEKLILATGCTPKPLEVPGKDLKGIHYINKESEAKHFVDALGACSGKERIAIAGGGFVAVEVAAALIGWGFEVHLLVPGPFVLPKLLNATLAKVMEDRLEVAGVKITYNCSVCEIFGENEHISSLKFAVSDGKSQRKKRSLTCTLLVAALGSSPNTAFMKGLKTAASKELIVNEIMQTSDPNIYAMGDIVTTPNSLGQLRRLPHVDFARTSAKQAAEAVFGANPQPFAYTPFFYCRLFEYTDNPFAFNFYGEKIGEPLVENNEKTHQTRALWNHEGKVMAAMIMSSPVPTDDDRAKLKRLAEWRPKSRAVDKIFKSVGFS